MPFGLKNAGATYQRFVGKVFGKQICRNLEAYVDDMIMKSREDKAHIADLRETFETLRIHSICLNPRKCTFGVRAGKFLGFIVNQCGI